MKHDVTAPGFPRPQSVYSQSLKPQLIFLNVPELEILPHIKKFFYSSVCYTSDTKNTNGLYQSKNTGGRKLQVLRTELLHLLFSAFKL